MYQNIFYDKENSKMHVWDDKLGYYKDNYKKYAYKKSKHGEYTSIYGDNLKKIYEPEIYKHNKENLFEADVKPRIRYLIDNYTGSDEASEQNYCFYDIEVYTNDSGFPDPEKAENIINSITFYLSKTEEYYVFLLDPDNDFDNNKKIDNNVNVNTYSTEEKLLIDTIKFISNSEITILTGWNSIDFDNPYYFNRIKNILGEEYLKKLSPIGLFDYNNYKNFNKYTIAGFSLLDYLKIYKNFTYSEKSSYSLDNIANIELGKGKIDYNGSLDKLWEENKNKFLKYNLEDVKIMVEIEDKMGYLDLATRISHIGHIPYELVTSSLKVIDSSILTYLKRIDKVAPSVQNKEKSDYAGGYVKDPDRGRHEWVYDLDFSSLYPSIICTLNLSLETKLGKIENWYEASEDDKVEMFDKTIEKSKMKEFIKNNDVSVAVNGVMYDMSKDGIIPAILDKWLDDRAQFKKLRDENKEEGNDELVEKYDKAQHAHKILANSLYGVTGNEYFRFNDYENSEAITLTGQESIKYAGKLANDYYNDEILDNETRQNYVYYGDTDSCRGDSIVNTDEYGEIEISELFKKIDNNTINTVVDNDDRKFVFPNNLNSKTYDNKNNEIIESEIEYIMAHVVEKEMFKITIENGNSVVVTEDHSVMIEDGEKLIEKKPIELCEDDVVISIK